MLKWIAWPCISDVLTVLLIGEEQEVCRIMSGSKSSFWTSLPVFLTALGTLIGASAGLIALFVSTNGGKTSASAGISATPTASHAGRTGVRLGGTGVKLGGTGGNPGGTGGNPGGTGVFPTMPSSTETNGRARQQTRNSSSVPQLNRPMSRHPR